MAILNVSTRELDAAKKTLAAVASPDKLLALECNVVKPHDCVAAAEAVAEFCGADKVAFLFNNAGIQGPPSAGGIIADSSPETIAAWQQIFNVNVFGQVHKPLSISLSLSIFYLCGQFLLLDSATVRCWMQELTRHCAGRVCRSR